jgi:hypothetical protein
MSDKLGVRQIGVQFVPHHIGYVPKIRIQTNRRTPVGITARRSLRPPTAPLAPSPPRAPHAATFADPNIAPGAKASDGGGQNITTAELRFIFWGNSWNTIGDAAWAEDANNNQKRWESLLSALTTIEDSTYLAALGQYGAATSFRYGSNMAIMTGPTPATFNEEDIQGVIANAIDNTSASENWVGVTPMMCVFVEPGPSNAGADGAHNYFDVGLLPQRVPYMWIGPDSILRVVSDDKHDGRDPGSRTRAAFGVEHYTTIFSHELTEIITDPFGQGVLVSPGPPSDPSNNEIGDVCRASWDGLVTGPIVQAYWSQKDGGCVVPEGLREYWQRVEDTPPFGKPGDPSSNLPGGPYGDLNKDPMKKPAHKFQVAYNGPDPEDLPPSQKHPHT